MRLAQLDAVRALAIGLVIVEHYAGQSVNVHFPIGAGSLGVGLFFALSGFLITSSLLVDAGSYGERSARFYGNFYMRRALRLLPALYLWIALLCALDIAPMRESWAWHAAYLTNFWISRGHPLVDFWSLAVEEQFYLLWPLVIAVTPRRMLLPVIMLLTVFLPILFRLVWVRAGLDPTLIKTLLITNVTELGFGSILALLCYRGQRPFQFDWYTPQAHRIFSLLAAASLAECILFWAVSGKQNPFRFYLNDAVCAVPFAWLILNAAIGFKGRARLFFDNPAVQYIGKISYGLYLTHHFTPLILLKLFGPMVRWQLGVFSLLAAFIICALSWRYIERPILSLKRYFEPKRKLAQPPLRSSAISAGAGSQRSDAELADSPALLGATIP